MDEAGLQFQEAKEEQGARGGYGPPVFREPRLTYLLCAGEDSRQLCCGRGRRGLGTANSKCYASFVENTKRKLLLHIIFLVVNCLVVCQPTPY
jgi:hypothetical protein